MSTEVLMPQKRNITREVTVAGANVTLTTADRKVVAALTASVIATLPPANKAAGGIYSFVIISIAAAETLTVKGQGNDIIRGASTSQTLVFDAVGDWGVFYSDGLDWVCLADKGGA
jgi:hypothetical protein